MCAFLIAELPGTDETCSYAHCLVAFEENDRIGFVHAAIVTRFDECDLFTAAHNSEGRRMCLTGGV